MQSNDRPPIPPPSVRAGRPAARPAFRSTTIVAVRDEGHVALAGDGQVTFGETIVKAGARKIRRLHQGEILAGFAGSAADALALSGRLEEKLAEFKGNLARAAVELAREWRTDRALRRLEALLVVADARLTFLVSGTGDLIEPDDGIVAIGSGAAPALAAARALKAHSDLGAEAIARAALEIAASIDIYTNADIHVETLPA